MVSKREQDGYMNGTDGRFYFTPAATEPTPVTHMTLQEALRASRDYQCYQARQQGRTCDGRPL